MYRGNFMPGGASPEKMMRQQYHSSPHHQAHSGAGSHLYDAAVGVGVGVGGHNDEGNNNNGLSTNLQDQYETNEVGQARKRQRLLGGGDAITMGSPHHPQDRARTLHHQGASGAGGGGAMGAASSGAHHGGMNMNMPPNMGVPGAGGQPPPGMENDLAAAIYFNDINNGHGGGYSNPAGRSGGGGGGGGGFPGAAAAAAGFGGFANFGASGLMPTGPGNPFVGDYGRLPQLRGPGAAFGGLGGGFNPYDQGMNMNMNHMGGMNHMNMNMNPMAGMNHMNMPQAGAMAGLPSAANRRAHIMALMDMENELQQQEAAAQAKAFPVGQGTGAGGGMPHLRSPMSAFAGGPTGSRMGALTSSSSTSMREPQDPDGVTQPASEGGDKPVAFYSTQATPAPQALPPIMEEGAAAHYSQRTHIPLGIDEDNNWLTEFQVKLSLLSLLLVLNNLI